MVTVVGNGHGDRSSNPGRDSAFHKMLISLGEVRIQLFFLQVLVDNKVDSTL